MIHFRSGCRFELIPFLERERKKGEGGRNTPLGTDAVEGDPS